MVGLRFAIFCGQQKLLLCALGYLRNIARVRFVSKKQGVVNVNRKVAKPKGTLEIGVIKGSMGVQPPRQIGH